MVAGSECEMALDRRWVIPSLAVALVGCNTTLLGSEVATQKLLVGANEPSPTPDVRTAPSPTPSPRVAPVPGEVDTLKYYIFGKRTSNLSTDRRTITLSVDAYDPDGGVLKIEWSQDSAGMGTLNTNRGNEVQWTVAREGTFLAKVKVTVTGTEKSGEPDVAYFVIPVVDGRIGANEIPPEISIAPQSVYLFKPLPSYLELSLEEQARLGIKQSAQLSATSYIYDPQTNSKSKLSGDFNEILWIAENPELVVVDDNGLVRAADGPATGSTSVTAASKTNSGSKAAARISVAYLDTEITLSYPTTTIFTGGGTPSTVQISGIVDYKNPADRGRVVYTDTLGRDIQWRSSNPSIAQVDLNGNVKTLADAATGDVTITARSKYDPNVTANVVIKVRGPVPVSLTIE